MFKSEVQLIFKRGIVGIEKKLTTHTTRKTFASTVLLYNDVSKEIVCELLGHYSLQVTQDSYSMVVKRKICEGLQKLKFKIIDF